MLRNWVLISFLRSFDALYKHTRRWPVQARVHLAASGTKEARNPVFIRSIITIPPHFFSKRYTHYCFVVVSQPIFRTLPCPPPPPSPSCMPSTQPFPFLFSESHTCIFLPQIQACTCIFSRFISPSFFQLIYMYVTPSYYTLYPMCLVLARTKPIKQTSPFPLFNIFEGIRRVPQQSGEPYLKGNAARMKTMKTGNLYRETGSVYFYLINVNLPSHLSERKVELVNLHTGHIFIRYKIKIYSLPFLQSSG